MAGCQDCFFGGKQVGYKGDITSPFVIVGESPGALELAEGIPFVGPAGKLLEDVFTPYKELLGVEPFVTNAIGCLPRQKDPAKLASACQRCNKRLQAELALHPRKVILALGNGAAWATTGNYNLKITQVRGTVYKSPLAEVGIIVTVHPSFLLRGGGNLQQFIRDIGYAVELFTGKQQQKAASTGKITKAGSFTPSPYTVVKSKKETDKIIKELQLGKIKVAAGDIETEGFNPRRKSIDPIEFTGKGILCMGLCYEDAHTYVIPSEYMSNGLFENDVEFCWHNGKFDIGWLREYGYTHSRVDDDTMLMSYMLNEKGGIHDLEQVGSDWLDAPNFKNMLDAYLPSRRHSYAHIPENVLHKYQAIDANLTFHLRHVLRKRIEADAKLCRAYERILMPASEFIHGVERRGFFVDLDKVNANETRLGNTEDEHERIFMRLAEETDAKFKGINIRSPKQVHDLLYAHLKLAPIGTSTDADTLLMLPSHPLVEALKAYRKVNKQNSTFVKAIKKKLDPDGRIHSTFKLHGTTTGRLSSSKPNMQNIPRDKNIRGQFVAAPGYAILEVDLAQAELRMLACLSRDKAMIDIFNSGVSLHDEVAEYLFGKGFNKEQKMIAKNINFGIVYGISASGLQDQVEIGAMELGSSVHVTRQEAQEWIDGWMTRFPEAAAFIEKCRFAPLRGQTIVSAFGYKRRFGVVGRDNLHNLQNEAANFPHQSGAHSITLLAGTELAPELNLDWDTWVVNEVHDALVNEIPDRMDYIVPIAIKMMETMARIPRDWGLTQVPFKAEAEIGYAWGNGKAFNPYQYLDNLHNLEGVSHGEIISA